MDKNSKTINSSKVNNSSKDNTDNTAKAIPLKMNNTDYIPTFNKSQIQRTQSSGYKFDENIYNKGSGLEKNATSISSVTSNKLDNKSTNNISNNVVANNTNNTNNTNNNNNNTSTTTFTNQNELNKDDKNADPSKSASKLSLDVTSKPFVPKDKSQQNLNNYGNMYNNMNMNQNPLNNRALNVSSATYNAQTGFNPGFNSSYNMSNYNYPRNNYINYNNNNSNYQNMNNNYSYSKINYSNANPANFNKDLYPKYDNINNKNNIYPNNGSIKINKDYVGETILNTQSNEYIPKEKREIQSSTTLSKDAAPFNTGSSTKTYTYTSNNNYKTENLASSKSIDNNNNSNNNNNNNNKEEKPFESSKDIQNPITEKDSNNEAKKFVTNEINESNNIKTEADKTSNDLNASNNQANITKKSKLNNIFGDNKKDHKSVEVNVVGKAELKKKPVVKNGDNINKNIQKVKNGLKILKDKEAQEKEEERLAKEAEQALKAEKLEKEKQEKQEKLKPSLVNKYFLVSNDYQRKLNVFDINYMLKYKEIDISNKTDLLTDKARKHLEDMKIVEEEKLQVKNNYANNRYSNYNNKNNKLNLSKTESKQSFAPNPTFNKGSNVVEFSRSKNVETKPDTAIPGTSSTATNALGKWGRKDLTNEIKQAEQQKELLEKGRLTDPERDQINNCLNRLTVDKYDEIKDELLLIISANYKDNQQKLVDVLFHRALNEKFFIGLYAKLCRDFIKYLPKDITKNIEVTEIIDGKQTKVKKEVKEAYIRQLLLDKSKAVFNFESVKLDEEGTIDEVVAKNKKYILGNIFFISELIANKVVNYTIAFQCLKSLFSKLHNDDNLDNNLSGARRLLTVEAILTLIDKFGTFVNNNRNNFNKGNEFNKCNSDLDNFINNLDTYVQNNTKNLPGHIVYKVINLIEKKKDGWKISEVEKTQKAKGLKEISNEENNRNVESNNNNNYKNNDNYSNNNNNNNNNNNSNNNNNYTMNQEEIIKNIKLEIIEFKNCSEKEKFNYETTTYLCSSCNVNLYNILSSIYELSIDLVDDSNMAKVVYTYFYEIYNYYIQYEDNTSIKSLKDLVVEIILNLDDTMLDNKLLNILFGQILLTVSFSNTKSIVKISEFDEIEIDDDSQVKGLFQAYRAIFYINNNNNIDNFKNQVLNSKLVAKYKDLYDSIVKPSK